MILFQGETISGRQSLVTSTGLKTWLVQLALVGAAVILPALSHLLGLPVRTLLPMHWPVLAAGVLLGWRGGLLVGALSPASNWLITGYPLPLVLPAMTLELAAYGFVAGWFRERLGWNAFGATAMGILAGRALFIAAIWLTNGYTGLFGEYLIMALMPGIYAAAVQVGIIGMVGHLRDSNAD